MRFPVIVVGLLAVAGSSGYRSGGSGSSGSGSDTHAERHCDGNVHVTDVMRNGSDEVLNTERHDCGVAAMVCSDEDGSASCDPPSPQQACERIRDECWIAITIDGSVIEPEQCATLTDMDECAWQCVYGDPCDAINACFTVVCPQPPGGGGGCCRSCENSRACGDSCISWAYDCHEAPGCACQG